MPLNTPPSIAPEHPNEQYPDPVLPHKPPPTGVGGRPIPGTGTVPSPGTGPSGPSGSPWPPSKTVPNPQFLPMGRLPVGGIVPLPYDLPPPIYFPGDPIPPNMPPAWSGRYGTVFTPPYPWSPLMWDPTWNPASPTPYTPTLIENPPPPNGTYQPYPQDAVDSIMGRYRRSIPPGYEPPTRGLPPRVLQPNLPVPIPEFPGSILKNTRIVFGIPGGVAFLLYNLFGEPSKLGQIRDCMETFLRQFGFSASEAGGHVDYLTGTTNPLNEMPHTKDELTARLTSMVQTACDNAMTVAQVDALLPGTSYCSDFGKCFRDAVRTCKCKKLPPADPAPTQNAVAALLAKIKGYEDQDHALWRDMTNYLLEAQRNAAWYGTPSYVAAGEKCRVAWQEIANLVTLKLVLRGYAADWFQTKKCLAIVEPPTCDNHCTQAEIDAYIAVLNTQADAGYAQFQKAAKDWTAFKANTTDPASKGCVHVSGTDWPQGPPPPPPPMVPPEFDEEADMWGGEVPGDPDVYYDGDPVDDPTVQPFTYAAMPDVGYAYQPSDPNWTFTGGGGISLNGTAFTSGNPAAPVGDRVIFLQQTGTATQTVTMPSGTYQVSIQAAQRGNYPGSQQSIAVTVDGVRVATFTPSGTNYKQMVSPYFTVSDGPHTISLQGLNPGGTDADTAFLCDIQTPLFYPSLKGGNFDTPIVTNWRFTPPMKATPWVFEGSAGVTCNQSDFTAGNPDAPTPQVAVLQMTGAMSQAVYLPYGIYKISFKAAQRANYQTGSQTLRLFVDDVPYMTIAPPSSQYSTIATGAFELPAGPHVIKLAGLATTDASAFVTNFKICTTNDPLSS